MPDLSLQLDDRLDNDPYLVWANQTKFRGYSRNSLGQFDIFQVAVLSKDGSNPFKVQIDPSEWPDLVLREIVTVPSNSATIYTGIVDFDNLQKLCSNPNFLVELNVPRYTPFAHAGSAPLIAPRPAALGKRVMAVIDFGCPFAHQQFRDHSAGTTRVRYFWDQDGKRTIRNGAEKSESRNKYWFAENSFRYGRETTSTELTSLFTACTVGGKLDEEQVYELANYPEMMQPRSHGGCVLDLAAGRINPRTGQQDQVSDADIIFVQLPRDTVNDTSGGSMTMYVLDALRYILDKTKDVEHVVINMSFGSTAGSHDATSLLTRGIDALITSARLERGKGRTVELVLPAGNHMLAGLHAGATLTKQQPSSTFLWEVMPDDYTDNFLEIWSHAGSDLRVELVSPSGASLVLASGNSKSFSPNGDRALVRASNSSNGAGDVVLIALAPTQSIDLQANTSAVRIESGIWKVTAVKDDINDNDALEINAWIERDDPMPWQSGQPQSRFLSNQVDRGIDALDIAPDCVQRANTGNALAYGNTPVVVGAYVLKTRFKPTDADVLLSPYSAAFQPAVNRAYLAPADETPALNGIFTAGNLSGTYSRINGTSAAAPQVARQLLCDERLRRFRNATSLTPLGDLRDARGIHLPRVD